MKIVRWNPRYNTMNLFNEFERWNTPTPASLPLDVIENEDGYVVEASVPGINPDDVEISFEDDVLTIKGEIKETAESEGVNYQIRERRFGEFGRSIRFPVNINVENVEATYTNGILTLIVPKAEEVKPKRIAIKAN
ncbi:MAG: Hsp20/alpha crystallin family protein [Anaerolineales bacterium]|nr:Hsp20/alpha crystallin family protein [Anaerolineales bacterium]